MIELDTGREHGHFDRAADVALCLAFEKFDRDREVRPRPSRGAVGRESHGFADVPDLTCDRIQFLDKANRGQRRAGPRRCAGKVGNDHGSPRAFSVSCLRWTIEEAEESRIRGCWWKPGESSSGTSTTPLRRSTGSDRKQLGSRWSNRRAHWPAALSSEQSCGSPYKESRARGGRCPPLVCAGVRTCGELQGFPPAPVCDGRHGRRTWMLYYSSSATNVEAAARGNRRPTARARRTRLEPNSLP